MSANSTDELETKWFDALSSKSLPRLQSLLKSNPVILTKEPVHCQVPNSQFRLQNQKLLFSEQDERCLLSDGAAAGRLRDRHITSLQRKKATPFHSSLTKEATKFLGSSTIAMNALQYALIQLDYDDSSEDSLNLWHSIIMFLVSSTPASDINQRYGAAANTSLHISSFLGEIEVTKALLAKGADVNAANGLGFTPLDVVDRDDQETLDLLRQAKSSTSKPKNSAMKKQPPPSTQPPSNPLADLGDHVEKVLSVDYPVNLSSSKSSTYLRDEKTQASSSINIDFEKSSILGEEDVDKVVDDTLPSWSDFQAKKPPSTATVGVVKASVASSVKKESATTLLPITPLSLKKKPLSSSKPVSPNKDEPTAAAATTATSNVKSNVGVQNLRAAFEDKSDAGLLKKTWQMIDQSATANEPVATLTPIVTETKISILQQAALLEQNLASELESPTAVENTEKNDAPFLTSAQLYGKWSKSLSDSKIIFGEDEVDAAIEEEQSAKVDSESKLKSETESPLKINAEEESKVEPEGKTELVSSEKLVSPVELVSSENSVSSVMVNAEISVVDGNITSDTAVPNIQIPLLSKETSNASVIINNDVSNDESAFSGVPVKKVQTEFLYQSFQDSIKENNPILHSTILDKHSPGNIRRHQAVYQSVRRQRLMFKYHDLYDSPSPDNDDNHGTLFLKLIRIQHVTLPSKTEAVPIFARIQYSDGKGNNHGNGLWCSPTVIAYRDQTDLQGETKLKGIPCDGTEGGQVNIDFCTSVSKSKLERGGTGDSFNLLKMFKSNGSESLALNAPGLNDDTRSVSSFNSTLHSPYYLLTTLEAINLDKLFLSKSKNRIQDVRIPFGLRHVVSKGSSSEDGSGGSSKKKSWSGVLHLQAFYLPNNEFQSEDGCDEIEKLESACKYLRDKEWFHTLHFEGFLGQKGGDLTFWKRRYFRLVGCFLLGYQETSFEARFEFDLRTVSLVTPIGRKSLLLKTTPGPAGTALDQVQQRIYQEEEEIMAELPRPHSFRLITVDGAKMDLCADSREEMVAWMKKLNGVLTETREHETFSHLILQE